MPVPGPPSLGRAVVVHTGDPVPAPWANAPVVTIDDGVLADPSAAVATLHAAWSERRPVVIALAVDPARYREPATTDVEPWTLHPQFEFGHDRLHFLTWANSYDARGGIEPIWWWARKAMRFGASASTQADIALADGTHAWVDGGPRGPLDVGPVIHAETVDLGRLDVAPQRRSPSAALARDQLAAVEHGAGPARIVAPAGSGKTRVLTERLRHLIVDRGVERELVLAVAYNKKAQLEMEARTGDFRPRISTLNALGHRLLGSPRVLDERDVRRILGGLVPTKQRRVNTDPIAPYVEGLSSIRLGLRDPEEVEAERDDVPGLAAAFGPYRRELARMEAVDFDEQVYAAIERLLRDGAFRRDAQAGCRHLLVDELQDLTPAHVLLLRLLASPALDVFGVGDDDQVIYGHAGADPAFLIDFAKLFPGAADHPLEVNYRCPVAVVDAARSLLSYNDRRVAKEIHAGPGASTASDALLVRLDAPLVGIVREWLDAPVPPSGIAVLTRVNSLLLAPHVALVEEGIPVASSLPRDILDHTGTRAALAYLRLGSQPRAMKPEDIVEVLRRPSRGLPQWFAKWLRGSMSVDSVRAIADRLDDEKVIPKVRALADDLQLVVDACASGTTRRVLEVVRDDVGLGGAMQLLDTSKGGQTSSQLDDLDALLQVAELHPEPSTFETWLRGVLAKPTDDAGVTLSTVHRVKGMEWDRVIVAGVHDGVMPHRLAEDIEEERRVLHVAITRCRHHVVVLGDASRRSPFLGELDGTAPRTPIRRPPPPSVKPARTVKEPAALSPAAEPVFEALRTWRRGRADGSPAYIVASDATLRAIAELRPATLQQLAKVPGIGPTKLELYGDEIIEVIASL